ncbi:MAG: aminodeoxychorismate synthase component I [Xanthomonadales bacterium]|nr:aminodeoxychorismate synthase component I [Xanthomonadales bacterium]
MTAPFHHPLDFVPDLLDVSEEQPQYAFLLESAAAGPLGSVSLLLRASGESLVLEAGETGGVQAPFLQCFDDWFRREAIEYKPDMNCPFLGGWFVYLGYELAGEIEPVLELPVASGELPVALAARCTGAVMVRHGEQPEAYLVAESRELLEQMKGEVRQATRRTKARCWSDEVTLSPDPEEDFLESVEKIKHYLRAGDVFQVNLSRAWHGRLSGPADPFALYESLRRHNPAPFAGMMRWRDNTLMCSSPERLVEVRGRQVQTRPIAGTYPRGGDSRSDKALSRDLLAHPKERAEHIMLIDLERNDLGRVCSSGSVEVNELMVLESYTHVHHIVSNVRGELRTDASPGEIIASVFPGGTITGCPKVRCMQIIAELEQTGRGFYTGSMGYISKDGQMDLNILIRTMLLDQRGISLRTGAGIVADSVPEKELAETHAKARGLLRAMGADQ